MDRRKFVKNIGVLGGVVLSGFPIGEAWAERKDDKSPVKGICSGQWDVIVIGGGAAGCAAAIAAAREGVRTLLVEAAGVLGGIGTLGLLPEWIPSPVQGDFIYSGIAGKILQATCEGHPSKLRARMNTMPVQSETLKNIYGHFVEEAGVAVWLNSRVVRVNMSGIGSIESVTVATVSGITVCKAKVFIDCTGYADIAERAGASLQQVKNGNQRQDAGFCFQIGNVDYYTYTYQFCAHRKATDKVIKNLVQSGKYPLLKESHFKHTQTYPSVVTFRMDAIGELREKDSQSASDLIARGRTIAGQMLQALQEYFPETFASAVLLDSAVQLYVPSRRIIGESILTIDDLKIRRTFPDEIGRNGYIVGMSYAYGKGDSHGIPYGVLTPKELDNLLVAGGSISTDAESYETLSTIPVCLVTGEAAGTAAGLVAKMKKADVHSVDTAMLRDRLCEASKA